MAIARGYEKLKIWEKSDQFAKKIYYFTERFPRGELYGLTSQLRRSALSIPANIVEGYARKSKKEFLNFLNIAYGSLNEADYLIKFSFDNKYLGQKEYEILSGLAYEVGSMLWAFMRQL